MIIGIIGLRGSGKDTVANHLVEKHNFEKDSFAKSLKDATAAIFGWDREMLEGGTPEARDKREMTDEWWSERMGRHITPRSVLQQLGTDVIRQNYFDDMWLATLENRIRLKPNRNVVISDVRFPNEVKSIVASGGKLIRVQRGAYPKWYDIAIKAVLGQDIAAIKKMNTVYSDVHSSEWAIAGYTVDENISNNSTIEDLHAKIDKFVSTYKF
jgi:dephospho-CoA kinase